MVYTFDKQPSDTRNSGILPIAFSRINDSIQVLNFQNSLIFFSPVQQKLINFSQTYYVSSLNLELFNFKENNKTISGILTFDYMEPGFSKSFLFYLYFDVECECN